jgi:hypothetical protein
VFITVGSLIEVKPDDMNITGFFQTDRESLMGRPLLAPPLDFREMPGVSWVGLTFEKATKCVF